MDRRQALTALGVSVPAAAILVHAADAAEHTDKKGSPVENLHAYLCAFHLVKKDPKVVIEAHHYCGAVHDELHQCVIYDTNGPAAKLLGVEYIIPDKVYRKLPEAERKYYHPHTYEVTSGLLVAPGLDPDAEAKFMGGLLTTWGKCWHTWPDPKTALPMGDPLLMWSATKDGQVGDALLAARDRQFKISTADIRKRRIVLGPVPQVEPPASLDQLGRQWTNDGPDEPARPK